MTDLEVSLLPTSQLVAEFKRRFDTVLIAYGNFETGDDPDPATEFRDKGSLFTLLGIAMYSVAKYQRHLRGKEVEADV